MNHFGLDIGSSTIKVAQVEKQGEKFRLLSLGNIVTPKPGLKSEAKKDHVEVAEAIKKLAKEVGVDSKQTVVALPEGQVASRVIKVPLMSEKELASSLQYEADAFVPFALEDAVLRHQIIEKKEDKDILEVLLVASPKRLVEKYSRIVKLAGFSPVALETELMSLNRALTNQKSLNTMVVDFGFKNCNFVISRQGQIYLTRSYPIGGETFTKTLASELDISYSQAEEYKKAYGFKKGVLEEKIRTTLSPLLDKVTEEMRKAIQYFQQEKKQSVEQIIMAGSSANLPEVAQEIVNRLHVEVKVADPLDLLEYDKAIFSQFEKNAPAYAVAIGLAKRQI